LRPIAAAPFAIIKDAIVLSRSLLKTIIVLSFFALSALTFSCGFSFLITALKALPSKLVDISLFPVLSHHAFISS
jgi:hypothetical protein